MVGTIVKIRIKFWEKCFSLRNIKYLHLLMNISTTLVFQLVLVCLRLSFRWILLRLMRVSPRSTSGVGWWRWTLKFGALGRCPKAEGSTWPSRIWVPACPSWLSECSTRNAPAWFKTLPISQRYACEGRRVAFTQTPPCPFSCLWLFADADRSRVHFVSHRSGKLHLQRRGSGRAH